MKVKVLFFGATAETVGKKEIEFEVPPELTGKSVFGIVLDAYPFLRKNFGKTLLFSINQEYSNGDEPISEGDELAIFTAVSGG